MATLISDKFYPASITAESEVRIHRNYGETISMHISGTVHQTCIITHLPCCPLCHNAQLLMCLQHPHRQRQRCHSAAAAPSLASAPAAAVSAESQTGFALSPPLLVFPPGLASCVPWWSPSPSWTPVSAGRWGKIQHHQITMWKHHHPGNEVCDESLKWLLKPGRHFHSQCLGSFSSGCARTVSCLPCPACVNLCQRNWWEWNATVTFDLCQRNWWEWNATTIFYLCPRNWWEWNATPIFDLGQRNWWEWNATAKFYLCQTNFNTLVLRKKSLGEKYFYSHMLSIHRWSLWELHLSVATTEILGCLLAGFVLLGMGYAYTVFPHLHIPFSPLLISLMFTYFHA